MNWGQYEISIYIKKPGNESQPGLCASGWRDIHYHFRDIRSEYFVGGVWSKITDKFLVGAGSTYALGATGGEATHTLTENELPSHHHTQTTGANNGGIANQIHYYNAGGYDGAGFQIPNWMTSHQLITTRDAGGGASHNNLPPYQAVYMWQRTA